MNAHEAKAFYENLKTLYSQTPNRLGGLEGSLDNGYVYIDSRTTIRLYIKKVIFNPPATIVFWSDDTKTIVKCQDNEIFDCEKGLTTAITKKFFGNKGNYCNEIKKWTKGQTKIIDSATAEVIMHDLAHHAYKKLVDTLHNKKSTKADLGMAMEEAIGYLGQLLDD